MKNQCTGFYSALQPPKVSKGLPFPHTLAGLCYPLFSWQQPFWLGWDRISMKFSFAFPWWIVRLDIYRYLLAIYFSSFETICLGLFVFLMFGSLSPLCTLDIKPLSDGQLSMMLSHFVGCSSLCWQFPLMNRCFFISWGPSCQLFLLLTAQLEHYLETIVLYLYLVVYCLFL